MRLEGEVDSHFTPDRARDERGVRSDKADGMPKFTAGNIAAKIVSVIRSIREIERLGNNLEICPLADLEVLGQFGVEFEDGIAAKWIKLGDGAIAADVIADSSARIVSSVGQPVRGIALGNDNGSRSTAAGV